MVTTMTRPRTGAELYMERHTATGNPTTTGFFHGPDGLLRYPGVDQTLYHTIVGALPGILAEIPWSPTTFMHETYEIITGIGDGSGDEPDTVCDDAPMGGNFLGGIITAAWGRYMRQTPEIDIGRLGQRVDRADPVDLRLGNMLPAITPMASATNRSGGDILRSEFARLMYERAIAFHRLLSKQIWLADPANNNVGAGYKEFNGLEKLINTGWKDAYTGASLTTLDPLIRSFNAAVHDNPSGLVEVLTMYWRNLNMLASRTGMNPVRWAFVMREQLYYEITKIWPCAYMTNMCDSGGNLVFNVDQSAMIRDRDDMRNNRFLLIDGQQVPVIFDDAISETESPAGVFTTSIYLLPFSVVGNRSVLYMQYFDFSNPDATAAMANQFIGQVVRDGAFLDVPSQKNYCIKWQARIEPRLVFRTPWLAGRLTDVKYSPLQQYRQPFPSDPYYLEDGETARPGPSLYQPV